LFHRFSLSYNFNWNNGIWEWWNNGKYQEAFQSSSIPTFQHSTIPFSSTYGQEIEEEPERNPERQASQKGLHAKLCKVIP
jgi:hypothetical protein